MDASKIFNCLQLQENVTGLEFLPALDIGCTGSLGLINTRESIPEKCC